MKHAGAGALEWLAPLRTELRGLAGLRERRPGIYYRGGQAWLHFHEDGDLLWADLKQGRSWLRLPASSAGECRALLAAARASLGPAR